MYLVKRIHWLLVEIEEELRFNASRKDADEVFRDVDRPSYLNTWKSRGKENEAR